MKVCILEGSPRKNGNTAALLEPFCEELLRGGAEVERIFLHDRDLQPCEACRTCQQKNRNAAERRQQSKKQVNRQAESSRKKREIKVLTVKIRSYKSDFLKIVHVVTDNVIYVGSGHFSRQQISHRIHMSAHKKLFPEFSIIYRSVP